MSWLLATAVIAVIAYHLGRRVERNDFLLRIEALTKGDDE